MGDTLLTGAVVALVLVGLQLLAWARRRPPAEQKPAPEHVRPGGCSAPLPPDDVVDQSAWDEWWKERLSARWIEHEFTHYWEITRALLPWMRSSGAESTLTAACGLSLEPRAFAAAGFMATAFDRSPTAVAYAREHTTLEEHLGAFLDDGDVRPGGSLTYTVGDLLDPSVCPGPFDVVACRRTVQYFARAGLADAALSALQQRLRPTGVLVIITHFSVIDISATEKIDAWLEREEYRVVRHWQPDPADFEPRFAGERRAWHTVGTG